MRATRSSSPLSRGSAGLAEPLVHPRRHLPDKATPVAKAAAPPDGRLQMPHLLEVIHRQAILAGAGEDLGAVAVGLAGARVQQYQTVKGRAGSPSKSIIVKSLPV